MNKSKKCTLLTDRLVLRPQKIRDYADAYKNYLNDENVAKYMTWHAYKSKAEALQWCVYAKKLPYYWAIVLKDEGAVIGSIGAQRQDSDAAALKHYAPDCTETDLVIFDLGYCIGAKWWGKGIVAEAAEAVKNHLFDQCGVDILIARHDERNPNSGKVMQKIGMSKFETEERQDRKSPSDKSVHSVYIIKKVGKKQ